MELDLANTQHQIFVLKLELLIEGIESADYDAVAVGDAAACPLGLWLRGAGAALAQLPAYARLAQEHEHFHREAGHMVSLFNAGEVAAARELLPRVVADASRAVSVAIADLKQAARSLQAPGTRKYPPPVPDAASTSLGIASIDAQHREIAEIIARLLVHPHEHLDAPTMADALRELGTLIALHFESEELFMKHVGVPAAELEAHRREHAELLDRYRDLVLPPGKHDAHGPCSVCLAVEYWITEHIRSHDVALKAYAHIPYPDQ